MAARLLRLAGLAGVLALALPGASTATAAVSCPNANPVVNENNCMGTGSSAFRMSNYNDTTLGGFSTQTSVNKGSSVQLKIGRSDALPGASQVDISVFRMGDYGGAGARLISAAGQNGVTVNNNLTCNSNATTGEYSCANWAITYTIPGAALPASGVYVAKVRAVNTGAESQIVFTVRDDNRSPKASVLFVLPVNSYNAYNNWGGKSMYFDKNGGPDTIAGNGRAVATSFDRPIDRQEASRDRFMGGPDYSLLQYLESQGYDISYTDDVAVHANPNVLKTHKIVVIPGHSEYWTLEMFNAFKAARDAGTTSVASFSANTAYWKVRYENANRRMVCYKTVQGTGSGNNGGATPNDPGPDGVAGTADDAVGADGVAGTADDRPQNATTTFRDNGAAPGSANAPAVGRVGPDMPENQLFGTMYIGDHESQSWPLTVPAANGSAEFSGDRTWRNAGLTTNVSTSIGADVIGWEWDAIPTQAQYLAKQPAGVKRISNTTITGTGANYLQDEGHAYQTTPPSGQSNTVQAVRYTAPSGAKVFSTGTMQWTQGLDDPRLKQATYNVLSDMAVQPVTPSASITLDPTGSNSPPSASFTISPSPVKPNQVATFNGSSSTDAGGSIVKYEWDLNGDGVYEVNSGATATVTKTYTAEATLDIRLKVTDNGGATDFTTRSLTIIGNQPPTAAFTATPNPVVTTQNVTLDGSTSSDSDGTIAKYEWDLDGNGTYEVDGGTTKTRTTSYATAGTRQVGLRVTDNGGKNATSTLPVTVNVGGVSNYGDTVLDTAGLKHYWRMGETNGTTLAPSKGTVPATVSSAQLGVPGGPAGDPNTAVRFNGSSSAGQAGVNLSSERTITLEFWLNWSSYANNDALAMELTSNFNTAAGGFLVDPNAPQFGGTFGVGIGAGASRNTAFFARPSAGAWHHYAIVLDTTAPAASQITPYVDGVAVAYQKSDSGVGASTFANAPLYLMSRAGNALLGNGDMDELAIYDRALSASTVSEHAASFGTNRRPVARFTMTPNPAQTGATVTFNGTTSTDSDGTIAKYDWDLDGNGTYETTSTNPTVTKSYASIADINVGLKVTDNLTGTDTETGVLHVGNQAPTAAFTATPNPVPVDQLVSFNASGSSDSDGTITKYEWDLDGNGTYERDTGTTKTTSLRYSTTGTRQVGLRVTDNGAKTATKTLPVTVNSGGVSNYGDAVLDTPSLTSYWRMGESSGTQFADSKGTATATNAGATLGTPGAVAGDPNTAASFAGAASASAPLNLSSTNVVTVEFWLKWNGYASDDRLAMEFSPNFNNGPGGFLVDPNAPQFGGTFGVGIGDGGSRNNVFFARPSAGQWHHYALVMDAAKPAASQITPYVDGAPVTYQKNDSGSGAGNFLNSTLYFMSRGGTALLGNGSLDELAVYKSALSAGTILEHYSSSGNNRRPTARLTASPSPVTTGQTVSLNASTSTDADGTITSYEFDLDGNGTYETDRGTTPTVTTSFATTGTKTVGVRVTDNQIGTDTETATVTVTTAAPTASFTWSPTPAVVGQSVTFNGSGSSAPAGSITKYEWDLDGNGTYEVSGASATTSTTYATTGTRDVSLRVTDNAAATATVTKAVLVKAATASYSQTVLGTAGLRNYWRFEETAGTTLADSAGTNPATTAGGPTLGVTGALAGTPGNATRFDGANDTAVANVNLSATGAATVEFWLKWTGFLNNDALAMELTNNFNDSDGGFLIDPNAFSGGFAIGIGRGANRTAVEFARPSAGAWHHVAITMDLSKPAATQITPYIDGQPVSFSMLASGSGGTAFANSVLNFMSRNGSALFGAGDLDELAVYDRALSAVTIADHYASGTP